MADLINDRATLSDTLRAIARQRAERDYGQHGADDALATLPEWKAAAYIDELRSRDASWSATYSHIDVAANEEARIMAASGNLHVALSNLLIKVVALYTAAAPGGNYDVGNRFADADPDVQAARAALRKAGGNANG